VSEEVYVSLVSGSIETNVEKIKRNMQAKAVAKAVDKIVKKN